MKEHTSKELSQRLKDKGFGAEHKSNWEKWEDFYEIVGEDETSMWDVACPAYTFTELWAVVPNEISYGDLEILKCCGKTLVQYSRGPATTRQEHESPAEALGLLVEWLIDNGHLEVSQ